MKLISRKSIRKFLIGGNFSYNLPVYLRPTTTLLNLYGQLYVLPEKYYEEHPEYRKLTFVQGLGAQKLGLPFMTDVSDPDSGYYYNYGILNPNGAGTGTIMGRTVEPAYTYFGIDPETGRILNGGPNSPMVAVTAEHDMIPIDNTWKYDPDYGWRQIWIPTDQGQILDADKEAARRSLLALNVEWGSAMGNPQANWYTDPQFLENTLAIPKFLVQSSAAAMLGGNLGGMTIPAAATNLGRGIMLGTMAMEGQDMYADWAQANLVSKMAEELNKINNFTGADFDRLSNIYGEDATIAMLLGWIEAQKYSISSSSGEINKNSNFTVEKNEPPKWFGWNDPNATFGDPSDLLLASTAGTALWPSKKISGSKLKWILAAALATAWVLSKTYKRHLTTEDYGNKHKAKLIIDVLNSKGYNFYGELGNKQQPYLVQTNQQNNPLVIVNPQLAVQDSSATSTSYGEATGGTTDVGSFNLNWNLVSVREPNDTTNQ